MIRVAIIGCGKIADKHASQIRRIPGAEIVGVCDQEKLMARQLAERLAIKHYFDDVQSILATCRPDVVHIATPPQSHYSLARQCLEDGCHIYVEKPFTLNSKEAEDLLSLADTVGRKVTVGHETQFMPAARDLRRLINEGYLGGPPVHMESMYGYDFSEEGFARALIGDKNHWVRRLPGGFLQNIISHGIGKIVEYLQDDEVTVRAYGFTSPFLESIDEPTIIDELRVLVSDSHRTTAFFTFSSQIGPPFHQLRVYGPKNSLFADYEHQTVIKVPKKELKSYAKHFIPPFTDAGQCLANGCRNINKFLKNEFHTESGMYFLTQAFYRAMTENTALPIPYRDILLTSRILDEIFSQVSHASQGGRVDWSQQNSGIGKM